MSAVGFCMVCSSHFDSESFVGHTCTPRRFKCGGCGETFPAYAFWMHHCTFHDAVMRLFKSAAPHSQAQRAGVGSEGNGDLHAEPRHLRLVAPTPADSHDGAA